VPNDACEHIEKEQLVSAHRAMRAFVGSQHSPKVSGQRALLSEIQEESGSLTKAAGSQQCGGLRA